MPATRARHPRPPLAEPRPVVTEIHGDHRVDPFAWLRERDDPAVRAYLRAENRYAEAMMRPSEPLQRRLYREMVARIRETDMGVPWPEGDWLYYARTLRGRQYPLWCRRPRRGGREQVMLDLNAMARGHPFLGLGVMDPSPDGQRLAYSTDHTGFREYTLRVKDLRTGALLPLVVEGARSVAWSADGSTLFFVTEDDTKRACRVWRQRLDGSGPELVFEESDARFSVGVELSRSRGAVFLTSQSATTSEVWWVPAARPASPPACLVPRLPGREAYPDHHGDRFYLVVNDTGDDFRLVSAPAADPAGWTELVPCREGVMLEGVDLFRHHMVRHERRGGFPRLVVVRLSDGETHDIDFPEPAYSAYGSVNAEFDTEVFRYGYESFVTPESVYEHHMEARTTTLLKRFEVRGPWDPARYVVERLQARATDGTLIPVSLVRRADRPAGPGPLLLQGYGAYGYPESVDFSSVRLSLLDRGVAVALAHVRGGGEMGKRWHDGGRMACKSNTFTDFIACAQHLVAEGLTAPDRLVIEGGSAGGLLVGAVLNLRPDLFRGAVLQVPFVDVVNTMLDDTLPLTTGEYEEWGDPREPEAYRRMRAYSPYDNLAPGPYPAMLVETSLHDSQVMYWEPAKYVARLRRLRTDGNPLLLRTRMDAGHGGASGRYDALREVAFTYAFILGVLGIVR